MYKQIYERQITLEEIFTIGWSIFTKHFNPILIITLLIYIPINIILYFTSNIITDLSGFKTYFDIIRILEALFGIIVTMGIAVIVERSTNREEVEDITWGEALNKSFSRWASCIGTNILGGIIVLLFMLLLIIPGIIWAVYYSFLVQAVVLRNVGGTEALAYSKSLVKGQWWKVFGVLLLINIVNMLITFTVGFIGAFLPEILGILTDSIIDIIGAYFTVTTTLFFINLDFVKNQYIPDEFIEVTTEE